MSYRNQLLSSTEGRSKENDATRMGLPAPSSCSTPLGLPCLVSRGEFLFIVLFVCGWVQRFYVVSFVFWPCPFPYSFSQHMVLIMCWKSRQAAGQTAMSPTESSKSSTTSKVSTTPYVLPFWAHHVWSGPSVGASSKTICLLGGESVHGLGRQSFFIVCLTACSWNSATGHSGWDSHLVS